MAKKVQKGVRVSPSDNVRQRVRAVRSRQRWSLAQLAERMGELGYPMDVSTIGKIERGQRGVSIDDVFALALALEVAVIHLCVPLSDDDRLAVTETRAMHPQLARRWARGFDPLDADRRIYLTEQPLSEIGDALAQLSQVQAAAVLPPPSLHTDRRRKDQS